MDTIFGIFLGENYFDTRALADIVFVCLHRCQQRSLSNHANWTTEENLSPVSAPDIPLPTLAFY
jgi:hypothetical protein